MDMQYIADIASILVNIEKDAVTEEKKERYRALVQEFEQYLKNRPTGDNFHTCESQDVTEDGVDVLDTCKCHFLASVYPRLLLQKCRRTYFLK